MAPEQPPLAVLPSRDGRGAWSAGVYLGGDLIAWVQFTATPLHVPETAAYTNRVVEVVTEAGFDLLEAGRPEMVRRVREVIEEMDALRDPEKQVAALRTRNAELEEMIRELKERIRVYEGEVD